jgi:polyhydroxybutyrate depolymerase
MKTSRRLLTIVLLTLLPRLAVSAALAQVNPPAATPPLDSTPAPVTTAPPVEREWTVDGVARKALVYLPPKVAEGKAPVIFAFHGHGGSMNQAARSFKLQAYWPEAIVVYMQGLPTVGQLTDPEGKKAGWQKGVGDEGDRDLKFFDAVYASLKTDYKIDETRVFAMGHSNGGGFTYLLWAARGDLFRAVAPSSSIPGARGRNLKPKPVLHVAGENDPLVKYAWQEMAIDLVKRVDSCEATGKPWAKVGDVTGTEYPSKSGNPVVTLIQPGGHVFPREAPALIVRFFKENSAAKTAATAP